MTAFGFFPKKPSRFLLVAAGGVSAAVQRAVVSPEQWFITFGDSDIDRPW
jgi:hypothetical protein